MKLIYCLLFFSLLILSSCSGYLDDEPQSGLTLEETFSRRSKTEAYLYNVYSYLPDEANIWRDTPWVGASDEADITWERDNYATYMINMGNFNPQNWQYNFWKHYYRGIRGASVFMENVWKCNELKQIEKDTYKAEARFLRAVYHFFLLRQYGPIIIIDEALEPSIDLDTGNKTRSSFDECVNFIVTELDSACSVLPLTIDDPKWYGRPTKGAALAFKARVLLYAASGLYNGNADYANFKTHEGVHFIAQEYDADKWKKAAAANKAVIDLNQYSLFYHTHNSKPEEDNDPFLSYQNLFIKPWNSEVIFCRPGNDLKGYEKHCAPRSVNGWNGCAVTQKQVDAYHMANGKQIWEEGSGYSENGFCDEDTRFTPIGTHKMYVNREPRFYASVVFNGAIWPFTGKKVQLYLTGNDGIKNSHDHSKTGYLIRKMVAPDSDVQNGKHVRRPLIYIRLGEIYLNYAEALNEYEPNNPDIAKYVNLIRHRAGLADLPAGLSQGDMRERIRRERQIELAFEGHRFFDTRRWKIAEKEDCGDFIGMNVYSGTSFEDESFFKRVVFEKRVFEKKNYLWPITQNEIDKAKHLIQNPFW